MELLEVLLKQLFGAEQAGGTTMAINIAMRSETSCVKIDRFSTCGGDETSVRFDPPLPLEEALLHARKYSDKGTFVHN